MRRIWKGGTALGKSDRQTPEAREHPESGHGGWKDRLPDPKRFPAWFRAWFLRNFIPSRARVKEIFLDGLWRQNPVLVLCLGFTAFLMTSTGLKTALGLGLATTFVLTGAELLISMLRKVVPPRHRNSTRTLCVATFTAAAELLADGLENLGLSVTLDLLPWPDYLAALERGDFDLYLGEVRLTADFDLTALLAGALNYGGYADEEALQRLDSFRAASGQGRDLSARRLYQRLAEEPPFAVLCFKNWSVLTQWSRIQGLTPTQSNVFHAFDQWVLT